MDKEEQFNKIEDVDMSGLSLLCKNSEINIHSIRPDSPASMVDIAPGDVVLSIVGETMTCSDILKARKILRSGDSKQIDIVLRGKNIIKRRSFKLQKRI